MIDNIEKQILFRLIKEADYISSKDLAFSLDTSEKTVLKYLNLLKNDLKDNGASLEVKHGYGSRLNVSDQDLFNDYLTDIGNSAIPSGKEERKIYVLSRLLNTVSCPVYLIRKIISISMIWLMNSIYRLPY